MALHSIGSLNTAALDQMRAAFLTRIPEFGDFTESDGRYWRYERAYKEELSTLCRSLLPRDLFGDRQNEASAEEIVRVARRVLTARLENGNEPQNMVGWRYFDFLRHLSASEQQSFVESFGNLLYGNEQSPERAERFTRSMWPVYQRTGARNPLAQARMFPTIFLMLTNPDDDIAVRTDMFDVAARDLVGRRILRDAPFSAGEYEDVLALAHGVRAQLEAWAWCPRDMIDVHSFLWVVTRKSYGGVADAEEA